MAPAQKSSLQAWLEYVDVQTGSPRRIGIEQNNLTIGRAGGELRLTDAQCSDIHAILTREAGSFVLRDLGSKNGTFVNDRPIVEIALNNLDKIQIGATQLTFRAAYLPEDGQKQVATPVTAPQTHESTAPGHYPDQVPTRIIVPFSMFTHSVRFWRAALNTGVTQLRASWPTHVFAILVLALEGYANGRGIPAVHMGLLLFATTISLGLIAITCSVFFAFDSLPDAPHRLTQSMRFTFQLSPFLLAVQTAFLAWNGYAHPRLGLYFLVATLPTAAFCALLFFQSRHAFGASLPRSLAFAITASVPWNLLMTGLMSFVV